MAEENAQLSGDVSRILASLLVAVALLLGITVLVGVQTFNHPSEVWSYTILAPNDDNLIKDLNRAGASGWEVVSARRATSGEGAAAAASYELILKRRGSSAFTP